MTSDGFRPDRRLTDQESEEDLDAEIHFHIEERVRRLQAGGMSEEEARAEALRRFGDVAEARTGMARETLAWLDRYVGEPGERDPE